MIESFEIENFKGIRKLSMRSLSPVTLIVGRNSVGKSSVLEALFLFHDHTAPGVFSILSSMRGGFVEPALLPWESLFYEMNTDNAMRFSLKSSDDKISRLEYTKDTSFVPTVSSAPSQDIMSQLLTTVKSSYSLRYDYMEEDYSEKGHFSPSQAGIITNIETSLEMDERRPMQSTIYIHSASANVTQQLMEWIGKLEINARKDEVLRVLKLIDPCVVDFFSAPQSGVSQLYVKKGKNAIPLKYAGDGMIRLLYIMTAILSNPNSLILIDEIENGFHYSLYNKIWELIGTLSMENNCQIIATTHNYEVIVAAKDALEETNHSDRFSLHRLALSDDEIIDNVYDSTLIKTAINADLEVR